MTKPLEYSRSRHQYRRDGRYFPNVTNILGVIPGGYKFAPGDGDFGQEVHLDLEAYNNGERDYKKFKHSDYVRQAVLAHKELKLSRAKIHAEKKLDHKSLFYAGSPDGFTDEIRRANKPPVKYMIDYKTGADLGIKYRLQGHSYVNLIDTDPEELRKWILVLIFLKSKSYRIKTFRYNPKLFNLFLHCLSVYRMSEDPRYFQHLMEGS